MRGMLDVKSEFKTKTGYEVCVTTTAGKALVSVDDQAFVFSEHDVKELWLQLKKAWEELKARREAERY
jgi:hypothetical protein